MYYYQKQYDLALEDTKIPLTEKGLRDEEDIIKAKNNLAYYYGMIHERKPLPPRQREEMTELADYLKRKYDKWTKGFDDPEWMETYAFVKARLAQTKDERQEVKKLIEEDLLLRQDLAEVRGGLRKSLAYLDKLDMNESLEEYFGPWFFTK